MSEEESKQKKCEEGLPPWMATFADMMALLMCFFVLLLSFAEVDAIRFKKMAESFKDAFGVQTDVPAADIVKGVSVITQTFVGATTEPVDTQMIRQETTDETQRDLQIKEGMEDQGQAEGQAEDQAPEQTEVDITEELMEAVQERLEEEVQESVRDLREAFREEIDEELITVDTEQTKIIIRIREKGSFPSGKASLNPGFLGVMDRISAKLATLPGNIVVAGHTDDRPIHTRRFRSNWELSSARAVTVVHAMLSNPDVDPARVLIEGHADVLPLATNDTPEGRALNRRVELVVERGQDEVAKEMMSLQQVEEAPKEETAEQEMPEEEAATKVIEEAEPVAPAGALETALEQLEQLEQEFGPGAQPEQPEAEALPTEGIESINSVPPPVEGGDQ